jgi:hypothetical protein
MVDKRTVAVWPNSLTLSLGKVTMTLRGWLEIIVKTAGDDSLGQPSVGAFDALSAD